MKSPKVQNWLANTGKIPFTLYTVIAAFGTYFCMYAFRKPFSAASFEGLHLSFMGQELQYKIVLVIAQVVGYALAKFIGIKVIAEMSGKRRALAILGMIGFAELMLLGFGLVSPPYNFPFMFLNGLSLGMIWGLVFSFLEGRTNTEILGAGLSVSFVVSSGMVKSVGKMLLNAGVSDFWMPFLVGLIFVVPLLVMVWMLNQIPPPSKEDEEMRTKRAPMSRDQRWKFTGTFFLGLFLLVVVYTLLTAFRDFRDNFMADILLELNITDSGIFTATEVPIALICLVTIGLTILIRNNMKAFMINHILIIIGMSLILISTAAFNAGWISPVIWLVLVGLGAYLGYIPFNCILFDRLIAAFKYVSNAGFLIYIADAFGYLGAILVMLYKNFGQQDLSWLSFLKHAGIIMGVVGITFSAGSMIYFHFKHKNWKGPKSDLQVSEENS